MKEKEPPKETAEAPIVQVSTLNTPAKVVVLHPGAYNLRVGIASESYPHVVPQIIARRIYNPQVMQLIHAHQ